MSRLSNALEVLEAVAKGSKAAAGLTAEAKVSFHEALAVVKPLQQAACPHPHPHPLPNQVADFYRFWQNLRSWC